MAHTSAASWHKQRAIRNSQEQDRKRPQGADVAHLSAATPAETWTYEPCLGLHVAEWGRRREKSHLQQRPAEGGRWAALSPAQRTHLAWVHTLIGC